MRPFSHPYRRFLLSIAHTSYLNRWFVLAFDLIISLFGSTAAYFILWIIFHFHFSMPFFSMLLIVSFLSSILGFVLFKTYKGIIRHSTLQSIWRIAAAMFFKIVILIIGCLLYASHFLTLIQLQLGCLLDFMISFTLLILIRVVLILAYQFTIHNFTTTKTKVLIYGMESAKTSLSNILNLNTRSPYIIAGYLQFQAKKITYTIGNFPAYIINKISELNSIVEENDIQGILFTSQKDILSERNRLVNYCLENSIKMFTIPPINQWQHKTATLRELNIDDLLGRSEIKVNPEEISKNLNQKTVLVTGAAGSIGSELCRQIASWNVSKLILLDSCETGMHNLRLELEENFPNLNFIPIIGDVRSPERINFVFSKHHPNIVFHAAAYKHVPLMEINPCEAIRVNSIGTQNVANNALKYEADSFVMISTDKAVNPTNVMGASKRLAEIYVQSLHYAVQSGIMKGKTNFMTTRFGNVLGSQGSVIPRFKSQIANGGPVTVTSPDITRYFMTIKEACLLVLEASTIGKGGEIMVFDMGEPVKIVELAKKMILLSGFQPNHDIAIEYTGLRPGEKLYEEVLNEAEKTQATPNEKIRIASVRKYEYLTIVKAFDELNHYSSSVDIDSTIKKTKEIIPEYISNNSEFSRFDIKK